MPIAQIRGEIKKIKTMKLTSSQDLQKIEVNIRQGL